MKYNIRLLTEQEIASTQGAEAFRAFNPNTLELSEPTIFETDKVVDGQVVTEIVTIDGEEVQQVVKEKWCKIHSTIDEILDEPENFIRPFSRTTRYTHHVVSFDEWKACVDGVDYETGKAKLKVLVLNQICASFGVTII